MTLKKHSFKRVVALMATVSVLVMTGCSNGEDKKDNTEITTTVDVETTTAESATSTTVEESTTTQIESTTEVTTTTQEATTTQPPTTTQEVTTTQKKIEPPTTTQRETTTEKQTTTQQPTTTTQEVATTPTTTQEIAIQESTTIHTHNYALQNTNPTCTEQGYTTYTCFCGHSYVDNYVEELGHIKVVQAAVEATYTSTGLTEGCYCSTCGEVLQKQEIVEQLKYKKYLFYTDVIKVRFSDVKSYYYKDGEGDMYTKYSFSQYTCKASNDALAVSDDPNDSLLYIGTRKVSFKMVLKLKCVTMGSHALSQEYVVKNNNGEIVYEGDIWLTDFRSNTTYTVEEYIDIPAVPGDYYIEFIED